MSVEGTCTMLPNQNVSIKMILFIRASACTSYWIPARADPRSKTTPSAASSAAWTATAKTTRIINIFEKKIEMKIPRDESLVILESMKKNRWKFPEMKVWWSWRVWKVFVCLFGRSLFFSYVSWSPCSLVVWKYVCTYVFASRKPVVLKTFYLEIETVKQEV